MGIGKLLSALPAWFGSLFGRRPVPAADASAPPMEAKTSPAAPLAEEEAPVAELPAVAPAASVVEPPAEGRVEEASSAAADEKPSQDLEEPAPEAAAEAEARVPVPAPDPEAEAVQKKVQELRARMADFSARKLEMEKLLEDFHYAQYLALGEILETSLVLRCRYQELKTGLSRAPEDQEALDRAEADLDDFRSARESGPQPAPELGKDEREELKRLYRTIAMRCHPDRAAAEDKEEAHALFLRTQAAYKAGDLAALRLLQGETGGGSAAGSSGPASREALEGLVSHLSGQATDLIMAIQTLQLDRTYRQALQRERWEDYFAGVKEDLVAEAAQLRREIERLQKTAAQLEAAPAPEQ